jgi:transcriptional regulator with XRE-family HTH domain
MARVGLGWTADDLAAAAGLSRNTVLTVEAEGDTRASTLEAIEDALTKAGVEFLGGDAPGLRLHEVSRPRKVAKRRVKR